jgi:hypothetical protein
LARYKDDVYDRIWYPFQLNEMKRLSTNEDLSSQGRFKLPAIVMSTAVTPVDARAPLQFHWNADNVNDQYYLYMHFNEVEELAANVIRAFNITVNDKLWFGPFIPVYRSVNTLSSTRPLTGAKRYQISLCKTQNSTIPPILNAYEVYKVKNFLQSETQQDDGKLALCLIEKHTTSFVLKYSILLVYFQLHELFLF